MITLDGLQIEHKRTEDLLELSNDKLNLKDSVITSLNDKTQNLNQIIDKQNNQFELEREKSELLEVEIKQQKRKTFWWKVGTGISLLFTLIFATTN